jgi:uncharacterized protein
MSRLLFWILLGWGAAIAYRVASRRRRPIGERAPPGADAGGSGGSSSGEGEAMVGCAQCGLNVPRSEALAAGARWYCSEQHLRLGDAQR